MEAKVPFLNISDKQYKLIGITWGFIFVAIFHYYQYFEQQQNSIVLTYFNSGFIIKAVIGMIVGYLVSFYILRWINRIK
jgi:uncharacterized membrane protein YidH (DUF202 family)